jgi:AcrR family transcriptional regulator
MKQESERSARAERIEDRIKRTAKSPATSQPPKILRSDTRMRLLAAALELFAKKGFEETTMRDLAQAVGIKVPGIYSHFETKQQILREATDWVMSDFNDTILLPDDPDNTAMERLRLIFRRFVLYAFDHPVLARAYDLISTALLLERIGDEEALLSLRRHVTVLNNRIRALVEKVLFDYQRSSVDAEMAAFAVTAMHDQMVRMYVPHGDPEKLIETCWSFARIILDGGREAAARDAPKARRPKPERRR